MQALADAGHEIGAHTVSHPALSELSAEHTRNEIRGSRDRLSSLLDIEITSFAYPFGDYDDATVATVRDLEFEAAVTFSVDSGNGLETPHCLPRVPVLDNPTREELEQQLTVAE